MRSFAFCGRIGEGLFGRTAATEPPAGIFSNNDGAGFWRRDVLVRGESLLVLSFEESLTPEVERFNIKLVALRVSIQKLFGYTLCLHIRTAVLALASFMVFDPAC